MNAVFYIEKCLTPKLSTNCDESQHHNEYGIRGSLLQDHFQFVVNGLNYANLEPNSAISAKVLSAVLILYKELLTDGPWSSEKCIEYAEELSARCETLYGIKAADLLRNSHAFDSQKIFDECMRTLHLKLTSNDFKKYPSLLEVYCSLIENIQEFNLLVDLKSMPASLCLIDDYSFDYKKKGLKCCKNILKHLEPEAFLGGNYYEVIYASLKKALMERDIEITRLVLDCLQELLRVAPTDSDFKTSASDQLFNNVLEQIQFESSLYRKAALFRFTKYLIETIGVNCVSRKGFQTAICHNLQECCHKGVDDILLLPVVLCLEEWLKHCWCAWRPCSGQSLLITLLKLLYTCKEELVERIAKITATLITLCTKEEKEKIIAKLQETRTQNEQFNNRVTLVNKYIHVN